MKLTSCHIVDCMCKLAEDPVEVLLLMSKLGPWWGCGKISDPEAHGMAETAYKTLSKAAGDGNAAEGKRLDVKDTLEFQERSWRQGQRR